MLYYSNCFKVDNDALPYCMAGGVSDVIIALRKL